MRLLLLLLVLWPLCATEWSAQLRYDVEIHEPPPTAEEQRSLRAMDQRMAALEERVEAALASSPKDRLQTRRRLRVDLAAVHEERRRIIERLGGRRVAATWSIALERAICSPAAVAAQTVAELQSAFSHRRILHASGTILDAADDQPLADRPAQPALLDCLGDAVSDFQGHPVHELRLPGVSGELVVGLPNPLRCISSEELLKLEDHAVLAALPGLPLRVRFASADGRWREWRLVECQPR